MSSGAPSPDPLQAPLQSREARPEWCSCNSGSPVDLRKQLPVSGSCLPEQRMRCAASRSGGHGMIDVIVFEGIDAVGKTAVARLVAEELGRPLSGLPTEEMRLVNDELLCDVSSRARYFYYMAAAIRLSERLDAAAGTPVVLDRYVDSVHAMHAPLHRDVAMHLLRSVTVRCPDLVFLEGCQYSAARS